MGPTSRPRVLVIEDDRQLMQALIVALSRAGYRVIEARDGQTGMLFAQEQKPDLVLLDVGLPDTEGFEVCQAIRGHLPDLPILMLTGRAEVEDRVTGLESGADDYLTKPFDDRELKARLDALLRRRDRGQKAPKALAFGSVRIDLEKRTATRDGKKLPLTKTEFAMLELLGRHEGRPVPRDNILAAVWGYARLPATRTVDTHVWRLRRKIGDDGQNPRWLIMTPGQGYSLVLSPVDGDLNAESK